MSSNIIHYLLDVLITKIIQNNNKMSEEVIENLIALFNVDFIDSVDLIESKKVTMVTNQVMSSSRSTHQSMATNQTKVMSNNSPRVIFCVETNENESKFTPNRYFCEIEVNYCSCDAFRKGVLNDSILLCKHLLASKLSNALNSFKTLIKSNEDMDRLWTKHILI